MTKATPAPKRAETTPEPAKNVGGRPRIARGASTSSEAADMRWTVRGIGPKIRDRAARSAQARNMTVGDWLIEAIIAKSRAEENGDQGTATAQTSTAGDNLPVVFDPRTYTDKLADLEERFAALEAKTPTFKEVGRDVLLIVRDVLRPKAQA
jgi:hypothetical protein